jgi:hypothetical protein
MNFEDFLKLHFFPSPSPLPTLPPLLVAAFLNGLKLVPVTGRTSLKTGKQKG